MWPLKGNQVETEDEVVDILSVPSDPSVVCVSRPLVLCVVLVTLLILRSLCSIIVSRSGYFRNQRKTRATTVAASTLSSEGEYLCCSSW